ncbi:MAG: hypothetical protein R3D05_15710 [Dongiaceae bacterium]
MVTVFLVLLVKICVGALILSIGVGSTFDDVLYLWRRPRLLLRALLAMYVLVPAATVLLVAVWPLDPAVKAAFLVLAVSAGAPLLPRKLEKFGSGQFIFSIVVTTSLLAIIVVPLWISLLAWHFEVSTEISPLTVAAMIAKAFLLPLVVGMILGRLLPELARRFADRATALAGIALMLASVALLIMHWRILLEVHLSGMTALVALMLIALAIGHTLGGPEAQNRPALAIACATRHIGIAVIVATTFPGPRTVVILAAYLIASTAVSIPYLKWRQHAAQRDKAIEGRI